MKKTVGFTLFIGVLCASMTSLAQVKVQNGSLVISENSLGADRAFVHIDKKSTTNYTQYGVYSRINQKHSVPDGDCIGVYGHATTSSTTGYPARYVGVIGSAYNPNTFFKYGIGVAGLIGTTGAHVGVYGGVTTSLPASLPNDLYAGYFSGQVYVSGKVSATSFVLSSDERLKQNIRSINGNDNAIGGLMRLNPVSYNLKQVEKQDVLSDTRGADSIVVTKRFDEKSQEFLKSHYGFLAQELQSVYPDLVYKGGDGYLEIDYVGLIPLLVSSIQELNDKISTLEKTLYANAPRAYAPAKALQEQEINSEAGAATLFQNAPNPFKENTTIAFYLPDNVENAMLCIYDMNGKMLAQNSITERGKAEFVVSGYKYNAGMYHYSLIADNQLIDTKKMILTK
ncbi:MAG: tail fiber domain-containing protein [Paludibacteraceae bacterium]